MNIKGHVQGFTVGAAVMGALMLGLAHLPTPTAPLAYMDEMAARFDVDIVWTNNSPCPAADGREYKGCYFSATPHLIYVSPNLSRPETRHTVLHEIGHVIQARLGLPLDECNADQFAQSLGSREGWYCPVEY